MNLKRSLALALSVMLILGVALPAALGAGETLDRIKGADRWATAVAVSQEGWGSADVVVLANGRNYPDALAGVPLAYSLNAPILLTEADSLVAATKAEITRLGATRVVILGGTGVISADVAEELEDMGLSVERISGADRFATAAEIAAEVAPTGVGTVVLASGRGFADALAAASYAAINGYPILLTEKNSLPEATEKAIVDLGATKVIVVGGTGVIAENAVKDLPGVTRVSGSNREGTSVALANHFALQTSKYFIATGDGFADAITGAVLAAKEGTGILLVRSSFPAVVGDFFANNNVANAVVFGGTGVVSEAVAKAAAAKLVKDPSGIAGFVTDGDNPVKEAVVSIAGRQATTDEDGFYSITGVAPGKYTVTVSKPGYKIASTENVVVSQNKLATNNLLLGEKVTGDVKIAGLVYDADTLAPVAADVTIKAWDKDQAKWVTVETGAANAVTGKFDVGSGSLATATQYQVTISRDVVSNPKDAYVAQTRTITTDAHQVANSFSQPFALKAVKPVTISGTALDKNGEKIPDDTTVTLKLGNDTIGTTTVANGEYEFKDYTLPSGTYTITTSLAENALYTTNVAISEGVDKTHNIRLVAGYAIDFQLGSNPVGKELTGTFVAQLYQGSTKVGGEFTGTIDPANHTLVDFVLTDLYPAGSYTLKVTGNYIISNNFPVTINKDNTTFSGRTALAGTVRGKVTGGGVALKDATVALLNSAGATVATTETDDAGAYSFNGVAAGTKYKVQVSHPDFVGKASSEFSVTVQQDNPVADIDLAAVATKGGMTGYLREVGTMALLNPTVTFIDKDDNEVVATVANGKYTITGLAPGTYTVLIENIGSHEIIVDTVTIVAGKTPVKHYYLTPGSDASVEVKSIKNNKGEDIAGADFALKDVYGNTFTVTGQKFEGLPAGTYTLTFNTPAGYLNVTRTITVAKGTALELNVVLVNSNTVTVPVYGYIFPGAPLPDATVAAFDATGKLIEYADTDDNGEAVFELVNGSYTFKVFAHGYYVAQVKVNVTENVKLDPIHLEMVQ